MQPGPGGGDLAIGDARRFCRADPVGETALSTPLPAHVGLLPQRVADTMSRHNRSRGPATRVQPVPRPRPPREAAPALTVLRPNAAGIDVHSDMHMVCVPAASVSPATGDGGLPAHVRRFGANSCDLHAIAEWLAACGVTTVALESTGVYWVPLFELLEARGFEVWLVEPGQLSRCGARPKTDALDAQWIQRLHTSEER